MIAKIFYTTYPKELLGYEIGAVRKESPKIRILDWHGVVINPADALKLNENWTDENSLEDFRETGRALAKDVFRQYDYYARDNRQAKKKYMHLIISFSSADIPRFEASPNLMHEIALNYLARMGFQDNQWLMTEHLDTESPHIHTMINRIGRDRKALPKAFDQVRSEKICQSLNEKYGLSKPGEAPIRSKERAERERVKQEIKRVVSEVIDEKKYSSFENLTNLLTARSISVKTYRYIKDLRSRNQGGISFAMSNVAVAGYKIGYPWQKVMKIIQDEQERLQKERESSPAAIIVRNLEKNMDGIRREIEKLHAVYDEIEYAGLSFEPETENALHILDEIWHQAQIIFQTMKESLSLEKIEEYITLLRQALIKYYHAIKQAAIEISKKMRGEFLARCQNVLHSLQGSMAFIAEKGIQPTKTLHDPINDHLREVQEEANESIKNALSQMKQIEEIRSTVIFAFKKNTEEDISQILQQRSFRIQFDVGRNTFRVLTEGMAVRAERFMNETERAEIIKQYQKVRAQKESKQMQPIRGMKLHI